MQLKKNRSGYLTIFLIAVLTITLILLPFLIYDHGALLLYRDFNHQQIPFTRLAHDAIRNGNIFWNWNTDLGANFIGSYSFYLLGSPFFWLTLPFPTSWIPYLMGPLVILKYGVAAVTSFAFIKRFTRTQSFAMVGALLFTFSSFMISNTFYNHFLDVVAFFPLLLIGMEELVLNRRKGVFALAVALNLIVNYWFFVGEAVFTCLYFFMRCLDPAFQMSLRKFGTLFFEAVLGLCLGMFLLLPSALALEGSTRLDEMMTLKTAFAYQYPELYGFLVQGFTMPADIQGFPNLFPTMNQGYTWRSVAAWLPLFGMCGVFSFLQHKRQHWLKYLLILCFVFAFVPILNSSFVLFNGTYYARWFYMFLLMMALATALILEQRRYEMKSGLKFCGIFITAFVLLGILPRISDGSFTFFGLPSSPAMYWCNILLAVASLFLAARLIKKFRRSPRQLAVYSMAGICCISILYGMTSIAFCKIDGESYEQIFDRSLNAEFELEGDEFYRVDVYNGMNNQAMYWGLPTIQAFHSIVPASVMELYPQIGVERFVMSTPDIEKQGVRGFTSVKYLFVKEEQRGFSPPAGYKFYDTQNGFDIYLNENYVPMGYTYDYYLDETQFKTMNQQHRDRLLLKGMLLNDEQIEAYKELLKPISENKNRWDYTITGLKTDCDALKNETAESFEIDNRGFTSKITLERDNLVYFSVPYDRGWKAYVNGMETKIEKVNVGFMAVAAAEGENDIRFEYTTPGLKAGLAVSGVGWIVFAAYLILCRVERKKQDHKSKA